MDKIFFELLRIALVALPRRSSKCVEEGLSASDMRLSVTPTIEQWNTLYKMALEQTLVGVLFPALELLPAEQRPPKGVLLQWYMMTERTIMQNRLLNKRAVETVEYFRNEGFGCCVLKGQGIATLYPNPLLRTSGDIDLWLGGGRKKIYEYARSRLGLQGLTYQHIHYPLHEDAEVEVHTTPGFLYAPLTNRRLQRYFETCAKVQFDNQVILPEETGVISVPTHEFNRIYILLHIYMHLFGEGIGMRQVLDYYYVLRQSVNEGSRQRTIAMLRQLRMLRFARAMMWIQQEVFALEKEHLIVEPDEKEGRFLLSEIMQAGNFGKYDQRIDRRNHHKLLPRLWNSLLRGWKFFVHYPHEMAWNVPFRAWQYVWSRLIKRK